MGFQVFFVNIHTLSSQQTNLALTDESLDKSQTTLIVTEEMLEDLVKNHNFEYKREKIKYNQNSRNIASIWNEIFPTIQGGITTNYNEPTQIFSEMWGNLFPELSSSMPTLQNQNGLWNTSVNFDIRLNLSAWSLFSILQTTSEYNLGKITFSAAKNRIFNSAKKTFHRLILDKQFLELQKAAVKLAEETYQNSVWGYSSGLTKRTDMMSSEVNLMNKRNAYQEQAVKYQNNLLTFKLLTGIPLEKDIKLDGKIIIRPQTMNSERLIRNHAEQNPALQAAQAKIWTERWQAYYAHANIIIPSLGISYNTHKIGKTVPSFIDSYQLEGNWREGLTVSLGVQIFFHKILPWSKDGLALWQSREQLKITKEDTKEMRMKTHINITRAVNKINNVHSNIKSLEFAYTLSEQTLKLVTTEYNSGTKGFAELKDSIINRDTALTQYLNAQFEYYSALLDLTELTKLDYKTLLKEEISS